VSGFYIFCVHKKTINFIDPMLFKLMPFRANFRYSVNIINNKDKSSVLFEYGEYNKLFLNCKQNLAKK